MFGKIKQRLYKLFINIFFPMFLFRILAKETFVFQEEFIVLLCFFFLFSYIVFIKKAPSQIYFNLEKQVIYFLSSFVSNSIIIFSLNRQLKNSNFIYKLSKIAICCDLILVYIKNLFKNKYTNFLSSYKTQFINKTIEYFFNKKEESIQLVSVVINKIYLIN